MLQYYLLVRGWARNRAFADTEYNVSDAPILPWHSDLAIIAGLCDLMKVCCCFNPQYTGAHCFPCYYVNAVAALILCNNVSLAHVSQRIFRNYNTSDCMVDKGIFLNSMFWKSLTDYFIFIYLEKASVWRKASLVDYLAFAILPNAVTDICASEVAPLRAWTKEFSLRPKPPYLISRAHLITIVVKWPPLLVSMFARFTLKS